MEYVNSLQSKLDEIVQGNFVCETSTLKEQFFEVQRKLEGAQLRLNLLPKFENEILLFKVNTIFVKTGRAMSSCVFHIELQ